jgi:thioredoxin reductase (NADPH)
VTENKQPEHKESFELRDFMQRSAVPFEWVELKSDEEARMWPGISSLMDRRLPVCELPNGVRLYNPRLRDLA